MMIAYKISLSYSHEIIVYISMNKLMKCMEPVYSGGLLIAPRVMGWGVLVGGGERKVWVMNRKKPEALHLILLLQ